MMIEKTLRDLIAGITGKEKCFNIWIFFIHRVKYYLKDSEVKINYEHKL